MKHLGDICKINGAEIEIVDVITGGSPCQDLSIAGKRAGLAGARSGLFMEQVRIVKEMRQRDRANGRTGDMVRPRFMVWENVPGAFSSNKGQDFAAVLEEIIRIAEPEAPDIEVPEKGWPTWGGYHDEVGGRWSVAWRVHDAQHWGVPQRRRRISVVADFGGDTAGEILFERKSVSGNPAESGTARERLAGNAESGAGKTEQCLTAWDCQSKRIFGTEGESPTLQGGVGGGVNNPAIFCMETQRDCVIPSQALTEVASTLRAGAGAPKHDADIRGRLAISYERAVCTGVRCLTPWEAQSARVYDQDGVWHSLNANENGGMARDSVMCYGSKPAVVAPAIALDMSHACDVIRECGDRAPSLQARMGTGGNQVPLTYQDVTGTLSPGAHAGSYNGQDAYNDMLVCGVTPDAARAILYQPKSAMEENWAASETKNALRAGESKVSHAVMCEDVSHALRAKAACAYREDAETYPVQNMVVRRLTPMECERLQGFPDHWTDIGEWTDEKGKKHKDADSPRYKALGNSIALPFWEWMLRRMARYLPEDATLGSLFDGIGGFPLVFERIHGKGTARWASEIEQFPIAVTKIRFPEEGVENGI